MSVEEYTIDRLKLKTGDIICLTDGGSNLVTGEFWRFVGKLIPGAVDHVAIYVGPGGRCVEAAAKFKVVTFDIKNNHWDSVTMKKQRGPINDKLHGIAYPLEGKGLTTIRENEIRINVAAYCLHQAEQRKPYNFDFINSKTEKAFYCSQLAYVAYLKEGIDLNSNKGIPRIPGTESIIFPQEIWEGCAHMDVI